MSGTTANGESDRLTLTKWLILILASIGFAFDIYEILVLPLVAEPALQELIGAHVQKGSPEFSYWIGLLFFVPAFFGGIFGLLGGYLTDRLGRRRVLTWSILIYAFSAFFAGFSTSPEMLLFFRCTTFIGVCVEFVAAVAWLAELFPNPKQRERALGYTQAFSSIGGLLAAFVFGAINDYWAPFLPAISMPEFLNFAGSVSNEHAPWRYTLMSGLLPAIPLILIRPFLPESPVWAKKKAAGTLQRPSIRALFAPELRRTTIVTTIMFACSYGAAFGALQHTPRMLSATPQIAAEIKEATKDAPNVKAKKMLARPIIDSNSAFITKIQEVGGLCGRFLLAILILRIASRRTLIRLFQGPGIIVLPLLYAVLLMRDVNLLYIGIFFAGLFTVGQFSFWGNYLPHVFPLHLRGTGESFAANIGGRMFGTSFAFVTATLLPPLMPGASQPEKLAYAAAAVGFFVFIVGFLMSFLLPEPKHDELPEFSDSDDQAPNVVTT